MDNNLQKAKDILVSQGHTCVLCKDDVIHTSDMRGVAPMLSIINSNSDVRGFSVADKVIGKAAAFLMVYAGIKSVFSFVISKGALEVLEDNNIQVIYDKLTDVIINRMGTGMCPMEEAVLNINNSSEALSAINKKIEELNKKAPTDN